MSEAQKATVHNHTELPARPDLIRLIIGIFGIGSSGPLIALQHNARTHTHFLAQPRWVTGDFAICATP
jgi:hypothetical protein